MNPLNRYRRRTDRALPAIRTALARPAPPPGAHPARPPVPGYRMAWTRLSDLPTVAGAPVMRRGIDLQAALARRVRRAPVTAVAALRHHTSSPAATPTVDGAPPRRPGVGEVER